MADFDSLFGDHCALFKRLECRWFSGDLVDRRTSRRRGHRMPFLRRNLSYVRRPPHASIATGGGDDRGDQNMPAAAKDCADGRKRRRAAATGGNNNAVGTKKRKTGGGAAAASSSATTKRRHGRAVASDAVWEVLTASTSTYHLHRFRGGTTPGGGTPNKGGRPHNLLLRCFKHACHNVNPALLSSPSRSTRGMERREAASGGTPNPNTSPSGGGGVRDEGGAPKDRFLSAQSSHGKVIEGVELASDTSIEDRKVAPSGSGSSTTKRALVMTAPRMVRATRAAEEEMQMKEDAKKKTGSTNWSSAASAGADAKEADAEAAADDDADVRPLPALAPYTPLSAKDGRLVPPRPPRTAYHLFSLAERDAARRSLPRGPDRRDKKKIERRLKGIWRKLSTDEMKRYLMGNMADKTRFEEERGVYLEAKETKKREKSILSSSGTSSEAGGADNTRISEANHRPEEAKDTKLAWAKTSRSSDEPLVYFHFPYLNPGDNDAPSAQVEIRDDRRCPICYFNYGTIHGLVVHGRTCHGPDVTFRPLRRDGDNLHVRVNGSVASPTISAETAGSDDSKDFVHVRGRCGADGIANLTMEDIPLFNAAASSCASASVPSAAAAGEVSSRRLPPQRKYYHSGTNLPLLPSEWQHGDDDGDDGSASDDSDDDPDTSDLSWLTRMGQELMDDFDDLSPQEKAFMNCWNRFARRHTVIGDKAVPALCVEFVRTRGAWLAERELRQNLLCHLFVMWDDGVIGSDHILRIMAAYDDVAGGGGAESGTGQASKGDNGGDGEAHSSDEAEDDSAPVKKKESPHQKQSPGKTSKVGGRKRGRSN